MMPADAERAQDTLWDGRSGRIVVLAHCLINQNSVAPGLARAGGIIGALVKMLLENDVGIIQLPCPETGFMGLRRFWQSIEQYSSTGFKKYCRRIAAEVSDILEEYVRNGFKILGVIGIAGSPSCGIHHVSSNPEWMGDPSRVKGETTRVKGRGVFMEELFKELKSRGIELPGIDYDHRDQEDSLKRLIDILREV